MTPVGSGLSPYASEVQLSGLRPEFSELKI
jgi:hypothetical protein